MARRRGREDATEVTEATEDDADGAHSRAFWSGTISFGLVSVPVALFPASRDGRASLRMLAPDGTPLERRWYCPADEKSVSWDELVRGYEMDDGSFVVMSDEEIEAAAPEKSRDIDLRRFVPVADLDPVFFERGYFLVAAGESTKAYRLLADAMEQSGMAGIATFVMRTREYLIAILAEDGILRGETLRWAGEVRSAQDIGLKKPPRPAPARVKALERAIAGLQEDALDEDELADPTAEALSRLVAEKLKEGRDVLEAPPEAIPVPADEQIIDLMAALKRSLQGDRPGRKGPKRADPLDDLSKDELYQRAQELGIEGRSGMTKPQLVAAIRKAG